MGFLSALFPCLRSERAVDSVPESPSQPPKSTVLVPLPEEAVQNIKNLVQEPSSVSTTRDMQTPEVKEEVPGEEPKDVSLEQDATDTIDTTQAVEALAQPESQSQSQSRLEVEVSQEEQNEVNKEEERPVVDSTGTAQPRKASVATAASRDEARRTLEEVTKLQSTDEANVPDLVPDLPTAVDNIPSQDEQTPITLTSTSSTSDDKFQRQQQRKASKRKSLARMFSKRQSQASQPNLQIPRSSKIAVPTSLSPITPTSLTAAGGSNNAVNEKSVEAVTDTRLEGRKWKDDTDNDSLYCY